LVEPDSRAELVENLARVRLVVALMRLQLGESHLIDRSEIGDSNHAAAL
jgi:hypothetical protein